MWFPVIVYSIWAPVATFSVILFLLFLAFAAKNVSFITSGIVSYEVV